MLCIQECKLRERATNPLNSIWPEALTIIAPTVDGVLANRNASTMSGLGGAFMAIGPSIFPFVSSHGVTPSGRPFGPTLITQLGEVLVF